MKVSLVVLVFLVFAAFPEENAASPPRGKQGLVLKQFTCTVHNFLFLIAAFKSGKCPKLAQFINCPMGFQTFCGNDNSCAGSKK